MDFSKIFVVFDPTRTEQPALDRAITVAEELGTAIHIFACIYADIPSQKDKSEEINRQIAEQKVALEAIAEAIDNHDAPVTTEVEWDKDWYKAVVRASVRNSASCVFKSTYKHAHHQRIFNKTSDFTLIRECLCPVLLVKEGTNERINRKVLAAVDVRAEEGIYAKLNDHIIKLSKRVLETENAEVHFINAYEDSMEYPDRSKLLRSCGVENDKIHIKMGSPEKVIVENAKSLDVSLVVIGSSGRTGLSAVVHGNTAEKVLDNLDCDILSVP